MTDLRKDAPVSRPLFVLNGPNLDMLGLREPALYGSSTLADVRGECERVSGEFGFDMFFGQSNAEFQLIEWLHDAYRADAAVIINPAGLSFRSIPLLDALLMMRSPIVEVHITNIHGRDENHRDSLVSPVATTVIAGAGVLGYELAIRAMDRLVSA